MGEVLQIHRSEESLLEELNIYKACMPENTIQLIQLNKILIEENDKKTKSIADLESVISNFDDWKKAVKNECNAKLEEMKKAHQHSKEVTAGINRSNEAQLNFELVNTKNKLKTVEAERDEKTRENDSLRGAVREYEAILKCRDEEIARLMSIESKSDIIIEIVKTIKDISEKNYARLNEVLDNPNATMQDVKRVVKTNKSELTKGINSKIRIEKENRKILELLESGMLKKDVAEELWPGVSSGPGKLSERLKSDFFKGTRWYRGRK